MTTGAALVARVIAGVEDPIVFGLPGGHTVPIFSELRHYPNVRGILAREESIAAFAAETYGRLSGLPAVVMGQGAWLIGVGGAGILEAHLSSTPMVVLADMTEGGDDSHMAPYQGGGGGYGAFDLPTAMGAITKRTFVARDARQAAEMTQLAFIHATSGEPGPVAVIFHSRAVRAEVGEIESAIDFERAIDPVVPVAPDAVIGRAADLLQSAQRPVVVLGNGSRRAAEAVVNLVSAYDLPFVTTAAGKSALAETDSHCAGVIGAFGHQSANSLLSNADVVLALGTKLGATDLLGRSPGLLTSRQKVIHVDVEPVNMGWTVPAEVRVLGLVEDVVPRLNEALAARADGSAGQTFGGEERVSRAKSADASWKVPPLREDDGNLNPRALVRLLAELLPEGSIVTCDAGENRLFMLHDYLTPTGGTVLQPNGAGAMGYAIPGAIGASFAQPDRPTVAVLGDGGFAMSIHALMTAKEQRRDLLAIVLNNDALGWVLHEQEESEHMALYESFDLAEISRAVGAVASTAVTESDFRNAIDAFATDGGLHVVVANVGLSESYRSLQQTLVDLTSGGE